MIMECGGRRLNPIQGEVFAVDKPLRWTSFDVVKRVRAKLAHQNLRTALA